MQLEEGAECLGQGPPAGRRGPSAVTGRSPKGFAKGGKVTGCLLLHRCPPTPQTCPLLQACAIPGSRECHLLREAHQTTADCKALEARLAPEPGAPPLSTWVRLGGTGGCPVSPFAAPEFEVLPEAGSPQTLSELATLPPTRGLCLAVVLVLRDLLLTELFSLKQYGRDHPPPHACARGLVCRHPCCKTGPFQEPHRSAPGVPARRGDACDGSSVERGGSEPAAGVAPPEAGGGQAGLHPDIRLGGGQALPGPERPQDGGEQVLVSRSPTIGGTLPQEPSSSQCRALVPSEAGRRVGGRAGAHGPLGPSQDPTFPSLGLWVGRTGPCCGHSLRRLHPSGGQGPAFSPSGPGLTPDGLGRHPQPGWHLCPESAGSAGCPALLSRSQPLGTDPVVRLMTLALQGPSSMGQRSPDRPKASQALAPVGPLEDPRGMPGGPGRSGSPGSLERCLLCSLVPALCSRGWGRGVGFPLGGCLWADRLLSCRGPGAGARPPCASGHLRGPSVRPPGLRGLLVLWSSTPGSPRGSLPAPGGKTPPYSCGRWGRATPPPSIRPLTRESHASRPLLPVPWPASLLPQ